MKRTSFRVIPMLLALLVILLVMLPTAAFADPPNPPDIAPQVHYTFNLNYAPGGIYAQGNTAAGYLPNVTAPAPDPSRTGYAFGGWFLTPACTGTAAMAHAGNQVAITENTDYYAKWTANPATVTFDSLGGTAVPNFVGAYAGLVTQPAAPMRAGYTFAGWYTDNGIFANAWNFASSTLTGNLTLYAKWSGIGPGILNVVNFMWNGTDPAASYWQTAVATGSTVSAPTAPTRAGYTFGGWYNESGCTTAYNFATLVSSADILYAKWTASLYTITYAVNGGLSVASATVSYGGGDTAPTLAGLLPTASKAGYAFGGWYYNAELTQAAASGDSVTASKTLYAKWLNLYTVTFHRNDGTPSDVLGFMAGIPAGSTITSVVGIAPVGSRPGYTWDGKWYSDPACTTQFVIGVAGTGTPVVGNMDVYAKWIVDTSYTVTFDSQGGSYVAPQTVSPLGARTVAKPANPTRAGYTFLNWSTSVGGAAFAFTGDTGAVAISSNTTLYANWVKTGAYRVVFLVDGVAYASSDYTYGDTYSIPTDPTKLGSTFYKWSNLSGDLRYPGDHILPAVSVFTNRTVTSNVVWNAVFTPINYTVTFSTTMGTAPGSQTLLYGAVVATPTAPTAAGYYLDGWYTSPNGAGTKWVFGAGASTVVTQTMTLYANWVPTYTVTLNRGSSVSTLTLTNALYGGSTNWDTINLNVVVPQGSKLVAPVYTPSGPNPTLANYTFVGWFKDSLSGPQWTFGTSTTGDTVTANVTLYAKFVKNQVTVTLHPKNGSGAIHASADYDAVTVSVTNPSLSGFTFLGWSTTDHAAPLAGGDIAAGVGTTNVLISNPTYFAVWSANDATLRVVTYRNGYVGTDLTPAVDNILSTFVVANNTVLSPLATVTRTGYTFGGWFNDGNANGVIDGADAVVTAPLTITANTNLVASWTINSYAVTFDPQGGTAVAGLSANYGTTISAPTAPTKAGFTFGGWYKEAACVHAWTFGGPTPDVVTANTTLYAKWLNNYTVTFVIDGSTVKQATDVVDGSQMTKGAGASQAPVDPTKTGYSFAGWYTATSGGTLFLAALPAVTPSLAVTGSITVYAQWSVDPVVVRTVTFNSAGGSYVAPQSVPNGGTAVVPTAPLLAGNTFKQWELSGAAYSFSAAVLGDITLTATWNADVSVQVYSLDNASVGAAYMTAYGSTITAPVDPAVSGNYAWNGKWYTDSGRGTQFNFATPITAGVTLYPGRILERVVTLNPNGGTPTPPVQNLVAGSKVTQPTVSRVGYLLDGWYVMNGSIVGPKWNFATDVTPTPAADLTLSAQWVLAYTVTFDPNYSGSLTTSVLSMYNGTIAAPANPVRTGYTFKGWFTDAAGVGHQWDFAFDKLLDNTTLYAKWQLSAEVTTETMRGTDRYDTAVLISQKAFPSPFAAGTGAVVLASGQTFQQALCGAPLAKAYDGVLLLTPNAILTNQVRNEIVRLHPARVFVVGMSTNINSLVRAAMPGATVTAIGTLTTDVYQISLLVAQALHTKLPGLDTAIVVPGDNAHFPDAISASPLAAAKGWPVLLTPSSLITPVLNPYAATAISTLGITKVVEAGTLTTMPGSVTVTQLVGLDRYDTAARVAEYGAAHGLSFAHLGIATGEKFPDALAAGPYLAQDNGVMLLSPLSGLSFYARASIIAHAAEVGKVSFFAMIPPVTTQVLALLP